MKSKRRQNQILLLCVLPALSVYLVFKLFPAVSGIYYAMTDWNGINREFGFVGFSNFIEVFSDRNFWRSVAFTFRYVAVVTLVANAAALLLAVAIESRRRMKGLFRTIYYMPNMISMVIGGYMWMFIFTRVVYYLADDWGMKFLDVSWIGNPSYAFVAIVVVSMWGSVGYLMIIYMAALQGISPQLREAAQLDGAGSFAVFRRIVFPLIRHAITICVFWTLNSAFQVFDVIYVLTGGGPGRATQSVALNIYEEAFTGNVRFGYATTKSTVLFVIVLLVTLVQLRLMRRKEHEM
ncbi:MAG: sugar ABC transporter permease [Clostridiales bacterium]|nr:sugar ABC transporter permease [Clostridiales bacterium]